MDRFLILLISSIIAILIQLAENFQDSTKEGCIIGHIYNIAHRGAPNLAPENTLPSFSKAIELGATMIELDVHQTKDNHLVVIHDASVNRTTNGFGKIKDINLSEIKKLDAGSWFSKEFAGTRIPLLQEVLDIVPDSVKLLIEIKYGSRVYPNIEKRVVQLINQMKAEQKVILKSFDDYVLEKFAEIAPEIPRLKIFVYQIPYFRMIIQRGIGFGSVFDLNVQYLQVHRFGLTEGFLRQAKEKGFKVFVWDVHTEVDMRRFINMGVDGIETDFPDLLAKVIKEEILRKKH